MSLSYPAPDATMFTTMNASFSDIRAVLQQVVGGVCKPNAFFEKKLNPSETKYSAFDRELLAIYILVKHIRYYINGRQFYINTAFKPFITTVSYNKNYTPRQLHQLLHLPAHHQYQVYKRDNQHPHRHSLMFHQHHLFQSH